MKQINLDGIEIQMCLGLIEASERQQKEDIEFHLKRGAKEEENFIKGGRRYARRILRLKNKFLRAAQGK